jgi:small subunit ribosomal protein S4
MKRKHKKYSKPKRPYDKTRIEEEAKIIKEFGLKNKKEIWKADAKINAMRERAKKLVTAESQDQKKFFEKLQKIGLKVDSIAEALSLNKTDYLNRRLQTVVFKKKMAPTVKTARQLITHKKVLVDGKIVNKPSYIVPVELESKITVKASKQKEEKKGVVEEVKKEIEDARTEEKPKPAEEVKEETE